MELLAPAGTPEAFLAALDAGADAIYFGAPGFHARNPARELTKRDIAAMRVLSEKRGVKLYAAINSLVKEDELTDLVEMLGFLDAIKVDALIVQDWGVVRLARTHFPALRLHASTLMNCHHTAGAAFLAAQGFDRVVLARETTLDEIGVIHRAHDVELEVFVHGALCFSYSGLCLFSSFLGGQSGLRGRCVQPCRRLYQHRQGKGKGKEGYFLSMNDLQAARYLPALAGAGVTSLKIEGRLKSASYVAAVTGAYRLLLDADWHDKKIWSRSLARAEEMLKNAMGRSVSTGFLLPRGHGQVQPGRSGNIGIFLGTPTYRRNKKGAALVCRLRSGLKVGDRLRLHLAVSGERISFKVKTMQVQGQDVRMARPRETVAIPVPPLQGQRTGKGDSLFLVDTARLRSESRDTLKRFVAARKKTVVPDTTIEVQHIMQRASELRRDAAAQKKPTGRSRTEVWVKCADFTVVAGVAAILQPERLLVTLTEETCRQWRERSRWLKERGLGITWALPPVILQKDIPLYEKMISGLVERGCHDWQVAQAGQLALLEGIHHLRIFGEYTLNVLNSESLAFFADKGVAAIQVLVESDRKNLQMVSSHAVPHALVGFTVYGRLPLSISRSDLPGFSGHEKLTSPRGEDFYVVRRGGFTVVLSKEQYSLLPSLDELTATGVDYMVIDFSYGLRDNRELKRVRTELSHWRKRKTARDGGRARGVPFNFFHGLE